MRDGLIGIEEHWIHEGIDRAQRALPPDRRDDSLLLNDHGDVAQQLADTGGGRLAAMDAQGVDVQVLSLAPPGTQGLDAADAVNRRLIYETWTDEVWDFYQRGLVLEQNES